MFDHHIQSIAKIQAHFEADPAVLALLLSGSIAHGYESASSDVDVVIILSDADYAEMVRSGRRLTFVSTELCTYPGGYVDGKYVSMEFIGKVAEKGSELARWAFDGVKILFSRVEGIEELLGQVVRYPVAEKTQRIVKFRAQLEAWHWYCSEARKRDNAYLQTVAASKLALFGTRLILAHNELLFPFHKWMLRVLEEAKDKPAGMVECIDRLCRQPTEANVEEFYEMVKNFRVWEENPSGWGTQYMLDVELSWMDGSSPVDDL
jgi:hypothetical protein